MHIRSIAIIAGFFCCTAFLRAADWPHWRGPGRDDVTAEVSGWKPGTAWPGEPVWKENFGIGSSSPVVSGGKIYVLGFQNDKDVLTCADAATGKTLWTQRYPARKHSRFATGDEGLYAGPTSTPEFDGATGLIYTLSLDGYLGCWDTKAGGKTVWHLNLYDTLGVKQRPKVGRQGLRDYGYTTSPMVHDEWVLVEAGSAQGTVIAFDKRTGRQAWRSVYDKPAGHSGGLVPMKVGGVPCVAVYSLFDLLVIRLDKGNEGKTVATHPWVTDFAQNIATPAALGESVIITSGYNHEQTVKLKISLDGTVRTEWEAAEHSLICSPVIHKGNVYFTWQQARCLDLETGKQRWAGGDFGDAGSCIVTGDQKLILWGKTGKLALVEATAAEFKVLAQLNKLSDTDAWPHVVLAEGRLFCKDRNGAVIGFKLGG